MQCTLRFGMNASRDGINQLQTIKTSHSDTKNNRTMADTKNNNDDDDDVVEGKGEASWRSFKTVIATGSSEMMVM